MSTVSLLDDVYKVRQGENRAAALRIIDRSTDTPIRQADLIKVTYTITKRGQVFTLQGTMPPDEPVQGHIDREIPLDECIRDDPPVDSIDNVAYNFLYIIPCVDENGEDITPFTESGATYDIMIRFFPIIGGYKKVMTKTIRIECE